jgi:recombination protein RecA
MLKLATIPGVHRLGQAGFSGAPAIAPGGTAPLWQLFAPGQLIELSGRAPGKLSAVVRLIARAQAEQEPVAWVGMREAACFYPPDFARAGVDLAALAVVRLTDAAGALGVVRAAEMLLRSGAFGLVILDLAHGVPKGELSWQARLSGLLRRHDARAVVLTESEHEQPSLGPLVSMRIEACWREGRGKRVLLEQTLLKSKLGGRVGVSPDVRALPAGA